MCQLQASPCRLLTEAFTQTPSPPPAPSRENPSASPQLLGATGQSPCRVRPLFMTHVSSNGAEARGPFASFRPGRNPGLRRATPQALSFAAGP